MNPTQGGWAILLSLLIALIAMVVHLPEASPDWLGLLRPNWLLIVLFFWSVELPHRVGLIAVWLFGFVVDALLAHPLGLNGFIMAATTYLAWRFYERLRMYSALQQCGVVFLITLAAQVLQRFVIGLDSERDWTAAVVVGPLVSMLAWPFIYLVLLRVRTSLRIE